MASPPTTYQVRARSVSRGAASVDAGNQTVPIDASWAAAEASGLPGPAELLSAAFAACLMKKLERSSAIMKFHYRRADIDVTARRQDSPPKFVEIEYEVRLVTDEDERRVDLLHRNLRQFGTVYNTLAAVCDVHGPSSASRCQLARVGDDRGGLRRCCGERDAVVLRRLPELESRR